MFQGVSSGTGERRPRLPDVAEEPKEGAEQAMSEPGPESSTADALQVASDRLGHLGGLSSSPPLQSPE